MSKSIQTGVPPVKVGDIIQLLVEGKGAKGDYFGKVQGYIIFIKSEDEIILEDEEVVEVKITKVDPRMGFAGLL